MKPIDKITYTPFWKAKERAEANGGYIEYDEYLAMMFSAVINRVNELIMNQNKMIKIINKLNNDEK